MNGDMLQWDYDKRKAGSSENAPFSPLWYKYSKFFVRTIHLNSGCVCCLASLGHIHTASVDEKPIACFLFLSSAHTLLVYTAATEKQEALGQRERWKQSNSLPNWQTSLLWLRSLHNTSVCVCSCRLWAQTQYRWRWAHLQLCECGPQVFIHIYWCMFLWIPVLSLYYILYETNDH